jgi:hypothetical protein
VQSDAVGVVLAEILKSQCPVHLRYEVTEGDFVENLYDALHCVNLLFQGLDVKRSVGSLYDLHRIQKSRVPFLRLQSPANYGLGGEDLWSPGTRKKRREKNLGGGGGTRQI